MSTIVLYATDTMADWEYSYLVAGVAMARERGDNRYELRVLSDDGQEVTTLGGLHVRPDGDLSDLDTESVAALVLPGGNTWNEGHEKVLGLASALVEKGTPVGGICGATLGLARTGLLNAKKHTSNALEFLTSATEYSGSLYYEDARVAVDGTLVTAPGTAPLEFSKAIFELLQLFPQPIVDAWYGLYSTGEKKYYDVLAGGGA